MLVQAVTWSKVSGKSEVKQLDLAASAEWASAHHKVLIFICFQDERPDRAKLPRESRQPARSPDGRRSSKGRLSPR